MRASLILLPILMACSDASAPRRGLGLTTELSSNSATIGQVVNVSLNARNTADTTVRLSFPLPAVFAEVEQNGQWLSGPVRDINSVGTGTATVDLPSGTDAPLGWVSVVFLSRVPFNGPPLGMGPGYGENFILSPGSYRVRACYYPFGLSTTLDPVPQAHCGNTVLFTLTQ